MPSHLDTRIEDGAAQSSRKIACGAARMQLIPDSQLGQFLPDVIIMLDIFFRCLINTILNGRCGKNACGVTSIG